MSDLWKQWAIVQRYPAPTCDKHPEGDPISCGWKHAYRELVASLPRPMLIQRFRWRRDYWISVCRLCDASQLFSTDWELCLDSALEHLHRNHGCPSWQASGEPCTDACEDCNGWGWRA